MLIVGIILFLLGGLLIYWNISYSPYSSSFYKDVESRAKSINKNENICRANEISMLPGPIQRYCSYIGLEGKPKYQVVRTTYHNTKFVMDSNTGKSIHMDYDCWLFGDKPYRSAYCRSYMFGILFEGLDYCTDNRQGGMKGMVGKLVQIFDQHNEAGYRATLISWLAESAAFNPGVLLSPYISYEVIDYNHVKATITYNDMIGTGIFTIDDEGAITEFYSDERQVEEIGGVLTPIGWRCKYENYQLKQNMLQIQKVSTAKVYPEKEVVYFDSDDFTLEYR